MRTTVSHIDPDLLDSIISKGLPKGNMMEFVAVSVLKYQKRMNKERMEALQDRIRKRENAAKGNVTAHNVERRPG